MSDHPAAPTLRNAISMFEADREGAAIASLRHAQTQLAATTGGAVAAIQGAIEAFEKGNDASALSWTRTALARLG